MSYHDQLLSVGLQYISIKIIDLVIGIDYILKTFSSTLHKRNCVLRFKLSFLHLHIQYVVKIRLYFQFQSFEMVFA